MIAVITLAGLHSAKAFLDVGRPYSAIRCQPSAWYIHQNIETEACRLRHGRILHHRARRLRSARNHARCRRPDFVTLSLASRDPELSTLASPVSDSEDPPVRPEELPACTVYLYDKSTRTHVYLVGSIHTSESSAEEVRQVIEAVQPRAVMLELCPSRFASMFPRRRKQGLATDQILSAPINVSVPLESRAVEQEGVDALEGKPGAQGGRGTAQSKEDKAQGTLVVNRALRGVYRLLGCIGMKPGRDFVAAVDVARLQGAQIVLGDRDVFTTMEQIAQACNINDAFNWTQISQGARGFADSVAPAAGGRVRLTEVLLLPSRVQEALPILSFLMLALALSGVLAWSTEALLGVSSGHP
jgi:hypothetical protein